MEKEIKIKVDFEANRKRFYNLVEKWMINEIYNLQDYDYDWFVDNVAKQGAPILAIDYYFSEDKYNSIIKVCYSFLTKNNTIEMDHIELTRQKQNFELPKYESGEQDND